MRHSDANPSERLLGLHADTQQESVSWPRFSIVRLLLNGLATYFLLAACCAYSQEAAPGSVTQELWQVAEQEHSEPDALLAYAGSYATDTRAVVNFYILEGKLLSELPGRPPLQLIPARHREFITRYVRFTFETDDRGRATAVLIRHNGRTAHATRISEERAWQIRRDIDRRIQTRQPSVQEQAMLQQLLVDVQHGEPKYEVLTESFASLLRNQITRIRARLSGLGELRSVEFQGVDPLGRDIYRAVFQRRTIECRVSISDDGRIAGLRIGRGKSHLGGAHDDSQDTRSTAARPGLNEYRR